MSCDKSAFGIHLTFDPENGSYGISSVIATTEKDKDKRRSTCTSSFLCIFHKKGD